MTTPAPKFVLDACSLIALIRREEGSENVASLLHQAEQGAVLLMVHPLPLPKCITMCCAPRGKDKADLTLTLIENLAIEVSFNLDASFIQALSSYKVAHKISFAESFVLALAQTQNAAVVSSDHHEFDAIAQSGILSFFWIR